MIGSNLLPIIGETLGAIFALPSLGDTFALVSIGEKFALASVGATLALNVAGDLPNLSFVAKDLPKFTTGGLTG